MFLIKFLSWSNWTIGYLNFKSVDFFAEKFGGDRTVEIQVAVGDGNDAQGQRMGRSNRDSLYPRYLPTLVDLRV